MHATFFQKFMLTIVSGFFAACLVWFYIHIIEQANTDVNGAYANTTGTPHAKTVRR